MTKYEIIELILVGLLALLKNIFSQSECLEVNDFIAVGEYGLALDTIVDIIDEESKNISTDIFNQILELTKLMELDDNIIRLRLVQYIEDSVS